MIWSQPESFISLIESRSASRRGVVQASRLIHHYLQALGHDLEPVRFIRAEKQRGRTEKLVTPYVTLSNAGRLTHPGRGLYAVQTTQVQRTYYKPETKTLFEEANALAERTALSRGIFTERGRATAEELILEAIPVHFRKPYAEERLEYLHVLQAEVAGAPETQFGSGSREQALRQLELGATVLDAATR